MTESMQGPNKGTKPCYECGAPTIAVSEILPALAHMRDSCVPLARVWVGEQKPAPCLPGYFDWRRVAELEVPIDCEWARGTGEHA